MRLKITLALLILAFLSGWKVHTWYEGNREKEVIIREVEVFNTQTIVDTTALLKAEKAIAKYKKIVEDLIYL